MDKNENIIKAMAECAGPDCSASCPYKDKGARNKSCRSMLLEDALAELVGLMADKETLNSEMDDLEASASAYRDERDKLREGWHDLCDERDKLAKECEELKGYAIALEKEGQEARTELDAERLANSKLEGDVDRLLDDSANREAAYKTVRAERDKLRAEIKALHADVDDLEAANHTLRAERDALRLELEEKRPALKAAQVENDILHQRCQVQQNEINALLLKNGEKDAKTDRLSVCLEGSTAYWCGRADALAEVVGHMFEGEAPCK